MIEAIILGAVQGVAEWLPVSSEGMIVIIKNNFFVQAEISELIRLALFLHLGTFLAALIYFKKDVWHLLKSLFNFKEADGETKQILIFLILATVISGILGFILLNIFENLSDGFEITSSLINLVVGVLLLITAYLQLRTSTLGQRNIKDLNKKDGVIAGIAQGLAVLPGLSRSGLTVASLLLRKVSDYEALKLSFLLSLPIVLGGNIILNYGKIEMSVYNLAAFISSFVFGILTIHLLLKIARKINFGYFVLGFGILLILAALI